MPALTMIEPVLPDDIRAAIALAPSNVTVNYDRGHWQVVGRTSVVHESYGTSTRYMSLHTHSAEEWLSAILQVSASAREMECRN